MEPHIISIAHILASPHFYLLSCTMILRGSTKLGASYSNRYESSIASKNPPLAFLLQVMHFEKLQCPHYSRNLPICVVTKG